jgi:hypothetical protein
VIIICRWHGKTGYINISHTLEELKDNTETKIGKTSALGGARPT